MYGIFPGIVLAIHSHPYSDINILPVRLMRIRMEEEEKLAIKLMNKIEESFGSMLIENGIVMATYKPGALFDIKVAKRILECRLEMVNGKSSPNFSDTTNVKFWTKEARDFTSTLENNVYITAEAMTIKSEVIKIITSFWLNFTSRHFI